MGKAQKQLDDVLGGERLPERSDMDQLPCIAAIVKETLRWAPPLPLGSAHRLTEDDIYKGMFIPAGATVMENVLIDFKKFAANTRVSIVSLRFAAKDFKLVKLRFERCITELRDLCSTSRIDYRLFSGSGARKGDQ